MPQVERDVRGAPVSPVRLRLQAAENDLLEDRSDAWLEDGRRVGRHPQPLAQAAARAGHAERQLAGGQLVEDHAQGEDVAARIAADAEQLLRRQVGRRAGLEPLLLREQIGKVGMPGEAEVEQHRLAGRAQEDVVRLEIAVDRVLLVQTVQRVRDGGADPPYLVHGQRSVLDARRQALAFHALHHQIGSPAQIPGGDEARDVRAAERRQDHRFRLVAKQALRGLAGLEPRHLHEQGEPRLRPGRAVDHALGAGVDRLPDDEVVDLLPRPQPLGGGSAPDHGVPRAKRSGSPAARTFRAAAR